jgi:hypothetical protein
MKEATVPVSPTAAALCDSACITCSGVIAFGGSRYGGGETPVERSRFFEHFYRS